MSALQPTLPSIAPQLDPHSASCPGVPWEGEEGESEGGRGESEMPPARRAQLEAPSPGVLDKRPRSPHPILSLACILNEITLGSLQETQGLKFLMGPTVQLVVE